MKGPTVRRYRRVRPRIQRAFLDWYGENHSRFAVPLRMKCRTDKSLRGGFNGVTRAISMNLHRTGLDIIVEWEGQCLDMLLSLDAVPRAVPGGYECSMCEPGERQLFPSRESLWIDHLFEPLLTWVSDKLAPAHWLRLTVAEGGSSAASLVLSNDERERPNRVLRLATDLANCCQGESVTVAGKDRVRVTLLPVRPVSTGRQVTIHCRRIFITP